MKTLKFRIVTTEPDGAEHVGVVAFDTPERAKETVDFMLAETPPNHLTHSIRPVMWTEPDAGREYALVAVRRVAECRIQQTVDEKGRVIAWADDGRLLSALRGAVTFMWDVVGIDIAISKRIKVDGIAFDVFPNGTVIAGVTA